MVEIITTNEDETRELGRRIGQLLEPGSVVALNGTLGAGKTRLTQGIGAGLGIPMQSIVSPTYTLCVPYAGRIQLIHLDAYRIKDTSEVDELGLDELLEDGAVLVVEWAARIKNFLPPIDIEIAIEHDKINSRTFRIQSNARFAATFAEIEGTDPISETTDGTDSVR
jgi:tRNA threonylcarbamoyladenosine biosynthesis protein TsaE